MRLTRTGPASPAAADEPAGLDMPIEDDGRPHPARDVAVGLFFLAWAGAGWISIASNPRLLADYGLDPGPGLLPLVVLAVLTLGAVAILATGIVGMARATGRRLPRPAKPPLAERLRPHLAPAAFVATLVAYPALMEGIGYTAATAVFLLGWILALTAWRQLGPGAARLRAVLVAVIATVVSVAILYAGFVVVIHAPLP